MTSITDIENSFIDYCVAMTGRTPVQGRVGEGEVPEGDLLIWRIAQITGSAPTAREGDYLLEPDAALQFELNLLRGDVLGDGVRIKSGLHSADRFWDLWPACGLDSVTMPQDLSAVEVGTFRKRAQMTVSLYTVLQISMPVVLSTGFDITIGGDTSAYDPERCSDG